jgi:starvation-inducible DNA-binding protein
MMQTNSPKQKKKLYEPLLHQESHEIQSEKTLRTMQIALPDDVREKNVEMLNQILIDSIFLYNMYKKHHWQVLGHTFYQLHLLFDKHADEQLELIDLLAERVQTLGGVAIGMPHDVAERTKISRPPAGAETPPAMISRLLGAHEIIIQAVHEGIRITEQDIDWGTNDLLMSDVLRRNELQVWFISSHLVDLNVVNDSANT